MKWSNKKKTQQTTIYRRESSSDAAREQQQKLTNWLDTFVHPNCNNFLFFTVTVIGLVSLSIHLYKTYKNEERKKKNHCIQSIEVMVTKSKQIKLETWGIYQVKTSSFKRTTLISSKHKEISFNWIEVNRNVQQQQQNLAHKTEPYQRPNVKLSEHCQQLSVELDGKWQCKKTPNNEHQLKKRNLLWGREKSTELKSNQA